jgi:hypothetical protein
MNFVKMSLGPEEPVLSADDFAPWASPNPTHLLRRERVLSFLSLLIRFQ